MELQRSLTGFERSPSVRNTAPKSLATMQYAIKPSPQLTTWKDMLAVWQEADKMDVFHSAWNFDHFYPINVPDTSGPCMEAWTTLTALAQATTRIRLGCMVTGIVYRHPALLANMIASVDIISDGRLELGIGAGWNEEECDAYGIELGTLAERFDRFDEACEIIHSMLTNDVTNFTGKYFNLTQARNNPPPVQKPHPPILIGGGGEKHTLRVVAKYADNWNWNLNGTISDYKRKLSILNQHCSTVSRDPNEIKLSLNVDFLVDTDENRIESALRVNADVMKKSIEEVRACSIVGSPEVVRSKLQSYVDLGVTSFIFSLRAPFGQKDTRELPNKEPRPLRYHATMNDVRRLCREVFPHFKN